MRPFVVAFIAVVGFAIQFATDVRAATITRHCAGQLTSKGVERCVVYLHGELHEGDARKLELFLSDPNNRRLFLQGIVLLDSPGGSVTEARLLAKVFRRWYASATVSAAGRATTCSSACFMLWISAAQREWTLKGRIGLHRPYLPDQMYRSAPTEVVSERQAGAMADLRAFFQAEGVPQRLIDEMMSRPSNDVYWLSPDDYWEDIGELAPWFEEIAVRECQYDRRLKDKLVELQMRGLLGKEEASKRRKAQNACTDRLLVRRRVANPF